MQMPTTHPTAADPTADRGAFLGSALACLMVFALLLAVDVLVWPDNRTQVFTQDQIRLAPALRADPS